MDKLVYWKDNWKPEPLSNTLPELFSFAKNKTISVPTAFEQDQLTNLFHLPLSEVSFVQLQSLSFDLNSLSLLENNDIWRLSSNSDLFSSTKVNRKLLGTTNGCGNPSVSQSTRFCFWLLLKDRLSTRNILRRKIMHLDSYNCVLCNLSEEETVDHLFMYCPFARDCWDLLNIHTS
jgi:hypothetical protein